jgi:hypothetical protein
MVGGLLAAALLVGVLAGPATAAGSGFMGVWVSTDPVDGSSQMLSISGGSAPSVVYQDAFASYCDRNGFPSTHWVAAGHGTIDGTVMLVEYHKSGCGVFGQGGYSDVLVYNGGTDTLVDGSGVTWSRAP